MPYLGTIQELLNDDTPLGTNLALTWYELRTNLRETCGKLATRHARLAFKLSAEYEEPLSHLR